MLNFLTLNSFLFIFSKIDLASIFFSLSFLEFLTRIFFNQRRKMIKNPMRQLFDDYLQISQKLNLDLNMRPQNLSINQYFELVKEYEKLRS